MGARIVILGLIYLLMLDFVLPAEKKAHFNFWQNFFTEPIETVYVIMKNGSPFKYTNYKECSIDLNAGILEQALKKKSYKIKDIAVIIHNHHIELEFSKSDHRIYGDLRKRGFNGLFILYCHQTNKTYCLEEKEKSK